MAKKPSRKKIKEANERKKAGGGDLKRRMKRADWTMLSRFMGRM